MRSAGIKIRWTRTPGSSLGLDIDQDIAELYRGSIKLGRTSSGGVSVQLALPAAD